MVSYQIHYLDPVSQDQKYLHHVELKKRRPNRFGTSPEHRRGSFIFLDGETGIRNRLKIGLFGLRVRGIHVERGDYHCVRIASRRQNVKEIRPAFYIVDGVDGDII